MKRFVQWIVGGGLALVAFLWLVALLERGPIPWFAGLGLARGTEARSGMSGPGPGV